MAMQFLNDVNFNNNALLNAVIENSTSAARPVSPVLGQFTYDTELLTILTFNGTAWVSVSDTDAVLSITATGPLNATEDGNRSVALTIDNASTTAVGVIQLAGDLNGVGTAATAPVVSGVGFGTADATTALEIRTAVDKSHDQNTDTGTTASSFVVDSDGAAAIQLVNNAGVLELKDAAGTGFVDLKVKDLVVEGTTTTINSNEVNIGDNEILLNAEITDDALNSDGGIAVKRLQSDDTTRADAKMTFNNTTGLWEVTDGAVTDVQTFSVARKFKTTVGDGSALSYTVTHNLNTQDVSVTIRESASPFAIVFTDVLCATVDTLTVTFKKAPTAGQYTVTVVG
jgi:hypothetical protein